MIVCASLSCPLLRREAYTPERVEQQLQDDLVRFVNIPEKVRLDMQAGVLHCSTIFQWYKADLPTTSPSIPACIRPHLQGADRSSPP